MKKSFFQSFKKKTDLIRLPKYNYSVGRKVDGKHVTSEQLPNISDSNIETLVINNEKKEINKTYLIRDEDLFSNNVPVNDKSHLRMNEFGIQMINNELFTKLFNKKQTEYDSSGIINLIQDLRKNNLFLNEVKTVPDVDLKLPDLKGRTIEEHFEKIGKDLSDPYKNLVLGLIEGIPEVPTNWQLQPGWTRYSEKGVESVSYPLEDVFVFDVEVCCKAGAAPTLATLVSPKAWYSWVSKDLFSNTDFKKSFYNTNDLIPLESTSRQKGYNLPHSLTKKRIAVGHSVSFDRSKIKEQYWLEQTGMRFLDTMSLHISLSGITSYQKALLKAGIGEEELSHLSSLNSLTKVHNLYCGKEICKEGRDLFISGTLDDIRTNFQEAMSYCALDVFATFNILQKIFPLFLQRFPHPVTLAGMLEIQTAYLPVNKNWNRYLSDSQHVYDDLDSEAKSLMTQCANYACELLHDENFKNDLWLWDQNWSCRELKLKKNYFSIDELINGCDGEKMDGAEETYEEKDLLENRISLLIKRFSSIFSKQKLLPSRPIHLPGYPEWYRKLCDPPSAESWIPEPTLMGPALKITPKLLGLTWKSMPVHHEKGAGWGFLVPYETSVNIEKENLLPIQKLHKYFLRVFREDLCSCPLNGDSSAFYCKQGRKRKSSKICKERLGYCCGLIKLPHKDGPSKNVGNPLARDFINKFSENALSADSFRAKRILEISRMLSYWRNNRERIESQFVCWLKSTDISFGSTDAGDLGAILPNLVVCGTLTRRAVEPTWMTATNSSIERVGSELRSMVQAPPGYSLVGADVDSQELWIASLLGDSFCAGLHGATPLGWMTLNGQKSAGTDMHSVTAKAVGISRDHAKVLNYARIYGAGEKFAQRLLKQFNENLSSSEAAEKSKKMIELTKGTKVFMLKEDVLQHVPERMYTRKEAYDLCTMHNKEVQEIFQKPQWLGGTESAMFNCLEMIANKTHPETPFLNCRLSRALEPQVEGSEKHLPTRINWVVQSGAVDFLHLMLVSMRWLLGSKPRFCLSFHDEVRYIVQDEHKYEAALALHVTNLLTRAFCVSRLQMTDLPMSVAFFSSVDVDKVLRKESKDDSKTPSNPFGLSKGYGIPLGESLDIYNAIKKANGKVGLVKE